MCTDKKHIEGKYITRVALSSTTLTLMLLVNPGLAGEIQCFILTMGPCTSVMWKFP